MEAVFVNSYINVMAERVNAKAPSRDNIFFLIESLVLQSHTQYDLLF